MTKWSAPDPAFRDRIERYATSPVMKDFFRLQLLHVESGEVTIGLDHRLELGHKPGWFEGAVTAMLGQMAAAWSCGTLAPEGWTLLTLEQSVKFVGAARGERLVGRGRVVKAGRTICFGAADVFAVDDSKESLCGTVAVTCHLSPPK